MPETDKTVKPATAGQEPRPYRQVRVRALDAERSPPVQANAVRQALVAALLAAAATALSVATSNTTADARFVYFEIAIVAAALYSGAPGGLFTIIVGIVVVLLLWRAPHGTMSIDGGARAFAVISFAVGGTIVTILASLLRRQARQLAIARDTAVAANERRRLVADAGRILSSSLDYETTVARVADLAVPAFADGCAVDVVVAGKIKRLAVAHAVPEKLRLLHELQLRVHPSLSEDTGVIAGVIRGGEPVYLPVVTDIMLEAAARDAKHLTALRQLGFRSAMVVPMSTRDMILGAISLVSCRPGVRFTEADFNTAQALGRRAGVAIDNARLYRAACKANETKSDFIATMSHELRTPLTAIIGFQELLTEQIHGPLSEGQRGSLERIRTNAQQLLTLVDEILLFRRLDDGTESVHVTSFRAKQVIDDVVRFGLALAAERGLELRAEEGAGVEVASDASKVRQILFTLVSNALKFTEKGEVVVSAYSSGEKVVFEVRDTGVGIDEANLDHIFDPFWQVDQSKTRRTGGSGLGLTVARRLAELLDGEITVESEPGVGSTFRLRLPKGAPATCLLESEKH